MLRKAKAYLYAVFEFWYFFEGKFHLNQFKFEESIDTGKDMIG